MVEKRPPMKPEEKQRLLDMADRILNSELGPFLGARQRCQEPFICIPALRHETVPDAFAAARVSSMLSKTRVHDVTHCIVHFHQPFSGEHHVQEL